MNEADTRAELIDKQLEAAGWKTGDDVRVFREFTINIKTQIVIENEKLF